jgi:hypothetical protein
MLVIFCEETWEVAPYYCLSAANTICRMPLRCYLDKKWMLFASYCFYYTLMFWASIISLGINFFFFLANFSANSTCCCCCNNIFLSLYFSFSISFSLIFSSFNLYFSILSLYFSFYLYNFLSFTGFAYAPATLQKYFSKSLVNFMNYSLAALNR